MSVAGLETTGMLHRSTRSTERYPSALSNPTPYYLPHPPLPFQVTVPELGPVVQVHGGSRDIRSALSVPRDVTVIVDIHYLSSR